MGRKELSLCHELKFLNSYIFAAWWCKPLIFQSGIIWSTLLGCKDIGIRKSEFVAKAHFLCYQSINNIYLKFMKNPQEIPKQLSTSSLKMQF